MISQPTGKPWPAVAIAAVSLLVILTGTDPAIAQQTSPLLRQTFTAIDDSQISLDANSLSTEDTTSLSTTTPLDLTTSDDGNTPSSRELPQSPVSTASSNGDFDPRSNLPASPIQSGIPSVDLTPFAPTGIRLGSFDLFPTLDINIGYTDNADFAFDGQPAWFNETTVGLRLQSDWSVHQFEIDLGATYQRFFNSDSTNLPAANANLSLRLDLARDYSLTLDGDYEFNTENADSSNLVVGGGVFVVDRPGVQRLNSSVELAKTEGRLLFSLRGSFDTSIYEDADLSDGTILDQTDRDNTVSALSGRLTYRASPVFSPFVQASIGRRLYDIKVDRNGNRRDSEVYDLRGGLEFDFSEKLTGEFAIGYTTENFKDAAIKDLGAVTFNGTLVWSPERLTIITANVATTLSPSTSSNDNGSVIYSANLGIARQVRPRLTLNANLRAFLEDFDTARREDLTLGIRAGYTYWFNRIVATTGSLSYENVDSTNPGSSYSVGTVRLGLKFQR